MAGKDSELAELHWMMDILQSIDVGLVVLDREYRVQIWNSFMANHSGLLPTRVIGKSIFEQFGELPEQWLRRKTASVFLLNNRAFTTWEQRPYLFRFRNYRPITGTAEFMYQNITFIPLMSVTGEVNHVALVIDDVTDIAVNKIELQAANQQLALLSRTDRLTQLNNRGYWEEALVSEFARVRRTQQPATVMMFDIDHFKKVNDTYGHPTGDEVIRNTANLLRQSVRTTDICGRYGGEEFGVILVNTRQADAHVVAERLRSRIEACTVEHEGQTIRYTISIGLAECSATLPDHKAWLERADQALYESKRGGRNRVTVAAA